MTESEIRKSLLSFAELNPRDLSWDVYDIPRISFHVHTVMQELNKPPSDISVCDVGGGVGLFSIACASLGFRRSVLVDDFSDPVNEKHGDSALEVHRKLGVEIVQADAVRDGLPFDGQIDAFTSFDSMEHWHHSPKRLFTQARQKLTPSGVFFLGVPNALNLRKRIAVPLGLGKWSRMSDWYESPTFRGHVREPDVDDLRYIARDMKLSKVQIIGRNWQGRNSRRTLMRAAATLADYPLRLRPSLCSDIYLLARKD
jgi:SAM-dependent methyltransferase